MGKGLATLLSLSYVWNVVHEEYINFTACIYRIRKKWKTAKYLQNIIIYTW